MDLRVEMSRGPVKIRGKMAPHPGARLGYNALTPARHPAGGPMLSILARPGRLCDAPSRRELLTVGAAGLAGLSLPDFLRGRSAQRRDVRRTGGFGKAEGVILLYLQGSPSHIDLW